ncbi:hypothetical protein O0L34_g1757 [Tuta absoluta]|nr:hypothetical protein O0L34_g1757 [Tuta absoluta]
MNILVVIFFIAVLSSPANLIDGAFSPQHPAFNQYRAHLQKSAVSRIMGAQETTIEKWPFIVQIMWDMSHFCGGSLLTRRHVLTAAHCLVNPLADGNLNPLNPEELVVRAGATRVTGDNGVLSQVIDFIIHENYLEIEHENDIAVMLIAEALPLGDTIKLAKLPNAEEVVPDGSLITYVGWGMILHGAIWQIILGPSEVLREVEVVKVNNDLCREKYLEVQDEVQGSIWPWWWNTTFHITDTMICAGLMDVGEKDACQGDSGGPAVYNGMVVGVVSWGHRCGHPRAMGVNARVASYIDWIDHAIRELSVDEVDDGDAIEEVEEVAEVEEKETAGNGTPTIQISCSLLIMFLYTIQH